MTLFTLPKWAALFLCAIISPGVSATACALLLIDSGYNWTGFVSGVLAAIALRDALNLKRDFFPRKGV